MRGEYRTTFAGSWYDQDHGGTFHVASTNADDLAAMIDEAYSRGLPLVGSVVAHSEVELNALTSRISAGDDPDIHAITYSVGADLIANTVVVSVAATDVDGVRSTLQAAGRTDVTVKAGTPHYAAAV
jgi:hypothetical protein